MRAKNEDTKIRIYEYINEYIKNNRVSPTINEIAKNAGCAVSTAYKFLERLKDEGLIDTAGRGRITSSVNNWEMGYAPILGMVACGKPKLAVEDIQGYLPIVFRQFIPKKERLLYTVCKLIVWHIISQEFMALIMFGRSI